MCRVSTALYIVQTAHFGPLFPTLFSSFPGPPTTRSPLFPCFPTCCYAKEFARLAMLDSEGRSSAATGAREQNPGCHGGDSNSDLLSSAAGEWWPREAHDCVVRSPSRRPRPASRNATVLRNMASLFRRDSAGAPSKVTPLSSPFAPHEEPRCSVHGHPGTWAPRLWPAQRQLKGADRNPVPLHCRSR